MTLITGDCVEVMAAMPEASVDAIVTDPPYGLEFMGKEWDQLFDKRVSGGFKTGGLGTNIAGRKAIGPSYRAGATAQEWHHRWAIEALRVAKPGAYLLAFGGTRTAHRLTCAIEDAGWIIRDTLVWAYASGFPKSRSLLKPAWEPIVMARKPGPLRELDIEGCRIGTSKGVPVSPGGGERPLYGNGWTGQPSDADGLDRNLGRWPANVILTDPIFDGGWDGVVGGAITTSGSAAQDGHRRSATLHDTEAGWRMRHSDDAGALYGDTGTYSRFFILPKAARAEREPGMPSGLEERRKADDGPIVERVHEPKPEAIAAYLRERRERLGLSRPEMDRRLGTVTLYSWFEGRPAGTQLPTPEMWWKIKEVLGFGDEHDREMTEVREVSLVERDARSTSQDLELMRRVAGLGKPRVNSHPTVKPLDLMRHLVRLVTPTGGTCLDPFAGSGTTLIAAEMEGFAWIGVEREESYVAIAEARLAGVQRGLGLSA